ncbi:hypothetical protein J4558_24290 [Leptolyngbya sp. 15MV]|nr:hypothetical protein J4558_24290 [Leptolyngbya sp. 15MV]
MTSLGIQSITTVDERAHVIADEQREPADHHRGRGGAASRGEQLHGLRELEGLVVGRGWLGVSLREAVGPGGQHVGAVGGDREGVGQAAARWGDERDLGGLVAGARAAAAQGRDRQDALNSDRAILACDDQRLAVARSAVVDPRDRPRTQGQCRRLTHLDPRADEPELVGSLPLDDGSGRHVRAFVGKAGADGQG